MKQQTYLLGGKINKKILFILQVIIFLIAFWYAPNDWSCWWIDRDSKTYRSVSIYDYSIYTKEIYENF